MSHEKESMIVLFRRGPGGTDAIVWVKETGQDALYAVPMPTLAPSHGPDFRVGAYELWTTEASDSKTANPQINIHNSKVFIECGTKALELLGGQSILRDDDAAGKSFYEELMPLLKRFDARRFDNDARSDSSSITSNTTKVSWVKMPNPFGDSYMRARMKKTLNEADSSIFNIICDRTDYKAAKGSGVRAVVDNIKFDFPNMTAPLDLVADYMAATDKVGSPAWFPPILLVGPPGIGKTECFSAIADALGVPVSFFSAGGQSSGALPLTGSDSQWKKAKPGLVASLIAQHGIVNPIVVIDELDKAATDMGNSLTSIYDYILAAIEKTTASRMVDEYLSAMFTYDASHVMWVALANDISRMPEPLLSRFKVHYIVKPSPEEMEAIIGRLAIKVGTMIGAEIDRPTFESRAKDVLVDMTPREARQSLERAVVRMILRGDTNVRYEDLDTPVKGRAPIGYTRSTKSGAP